MVIYVLKSGIFASSCNRLTELFESSESQRYIKKEILLKTLEFMLKETDPWDPELVEFVKTLIVHPPDEELNLNSKSKEDFSQIGQSKLIDKLLHAKRGGFFIEAGGHDGEANSNSLFFELTRN